MGKSGSRKVALRLAAVMVIGSVALARVYAQAAPDAEGVLMLQYQQEVRARRGPGDRRALHEKWERVFSEALAQPADGWTRSRLRMRSELGAIQRELGHKDRAFTTWLGWAVGARELGDTPHRVLALSSLWALVKYRGNDQRQQVVALIDEAHKELRVQADPHTTSQFADFFASMAIVYRNEGNRLLKRSSLNPENTKKGKRLLVEAVARMRQSLAIPADGAESRLSRQFAFGGILMAAGDRQGASAQFKAILAMPDQDVYAKTWVAHLKAKADFDGASPAYVKALEAIVRDYDPDDYASVLKQALAGRYSRVGGDYKKAISVYKEIIDLPDKDGVNATNMLALAHCYAALKQNETARATLRELVKRYPNTGAAGPARERLKEMGTADRAKE